MRIDPSFIRKAAAPLFLFLLWFSPAANAGEKPLKDLQEAVEYLVQYGGLTNKETKALLTRRLKGAML